MARSVNPVSAAIEVLYAEASEYRGKNRKFGEQTLVIGPDVVVVGVRNDLRVSGSRGSFMDSVVLYAKVNGKRASRAKAEEVGARAVAEGRIAG